MRLRWGLPPSERGLLLHGGARRVARLLLGLDDGTGRLLFLWLVRWQLGAVVELVDVGREERLVLRRGEQVVLRGGPVRGSLHLLNALLNARLSSRDCLLGTSAVGSVG